MKYAVLDPVVTRGEYRAVLHIQKGRHLDLSIAGGWRNILVNWRRAGVTARRTFSRLGKPGIVVVGIASYVGCRIAIVTVSRPTPPRIDPGRTPIPVSEPRPAKSPARPPAESETPPEAAVPATPAETSAETSAKAEPRAEPVSVA